MDGLPGTNNAQTTMKSDGITPLKKMVGPLAPTRFGYQHNSFGVGHMLLVAVLSAFFTAALILYGAQIADALLERVPADVRVAVASPLEKIR